MLYIWLPEQQQSWLWKMDDQPWQMATSIEQLIQMVQPLYSHQEAIVFFPAQMALYYQQDLPSQAYRALRQQGLAYLLEEYSIEPIEHLTVFHHYRQQHIEMMAVGKSLIETLQHSLQLLPWKIQALLPDFLILPPPAADQANIAQIFDRQIIRTANYQGWTLEDVELLPTLTTAKTLNIYSVREEFAQDIAKYCAAQTIEQISSLPEPGNLKHHAFNILWVQKKSAAISKYWQACAAILLLAIAVQVIFDGLRWFKYRQLANHTAQLAITQYQQWFPQETRVSEQNLTALFKAKLRSNPTADMQALQLISRVGSVLQQSHLQAQQVQYQDRQLSLQLLAKNSNDLEKLTQQLKQQGLNVQLGSIQNQGSQVLGMVKVQ